MNQLIILDHTGDTRVSFKPDDDAAVSSCMATFDALIKGGHWAAAEYANGDRRLIRSFDRTAVKTTIHPQLVGG